MPEYETLLYEEKDGVAWVTMNRPEANNSFDQTMMRELKETWRALRHNDDVRCVVLTGAGDEAFCTGIDRTQIIKDGYEDRVPEPGMPGFGLNPWTYDDVGDSICPKANGLWTPVIAAINGIACAGAFYMIGEAEFVIASDNAQFFDPHVTYGMVAAYESIHLMQKAPFQEVMRLALLGNHERMSAERAREIGLVSEVVPLADLHDTVEWAASRIAGQPRDAVMGTVRALWMGLHVNRRDAINMAPMVVKLGTDSENVKAGQAAFTDKSRPDYRVR
jgi:enoyl-CoA hydratase/carnithine racemase